MNSWFRNTMSHRRSKVNWNRLSSRIWRLQQGFSPLNLSPRRTWSQFTCRRLISLLNELWSNRKRKVWSPKRLSSSQRLWGISLTNSPNDWWRIPTSSTNVVSSLFTSTGSSRPVGSLRHSSRKEKQPNFHSTTYNRPFVRKKPNHTPSTHWRSIALPRWSIMRISNSQGKKSLTSQLRPKLSENTKIMGTMSFMIAFYWPRGKLPFKRMKLNR